MGANRAQVVRHVIVPGALPEILVGLRIGMGVGWTTLVAAEMVAADAGLGKMVYNASNFLRTDVVILGILAHRLRRLRVRAPDALVRTLGRAVEREGVGRGLAETGFKFGFGP